MCKSFKVLSLAMAAATAMLVGVLVASTAFADNPPTTPTDYFTIFMGKVAQNLGVDQQKLTDAITKARGEMIDEAVKDGRMTQQQADWIKQRQQQDCFGPGFGGGPMMRGHGWGGTAGAPFGGPFGGPWQGAPAPTPGQ